MAVSGQIQGNKTTPDENYTRESSLTECRSDCHCFARG
jgi:hypothetical protein